ncbi:MAG: hypothetical protein ABW063_00295 [Caulobacter sp.]
MKLLSKLLLAASVAAVATPVALAQAGSGMKTAWGAPDLQGFWTNISLTTMQRAPTIDKLVLSEEEAAKLVGRNTYTNVYKQEAGVSKLDQAATDKLLGDKNANRGYNAFWIDPGNNYAKVKGEYRSSWITSPANGRIPYSDAGIAANTRSANFDDYEARPLPERCLMSFTGSAGPVMNNGLYNNTYQIVQSPTSVMILTEMIHDVRVIPIVASAAEAKHGPSEIPKWGGDSVGWYEGDTLVVRTVNSHPRQRSYITPAGVVTERYQRHADGEVFYQFKVEDPTLYTTAWSGEMSLMASQEPLYEYACHEGNYAFAGIMGGARELDRQGRPHPPEKATFAGVDEPDGE